MQILAWGILKVSSFDFLKIESDFDFLFSFPRYKQLKNGSEMPQFAP